MKKILTFFSYLLHPVFIPLFGALVYLFCVENYLDVFSKYLLLIQITLITIFIPLTFLYFLKVIGRVDSIMVSDVSQRKIPLFVQIILVTLLVLKSVTFENVPELFFFYLGGIVSAILAFILLFFNVKASIHTTGISSLTVFVIGLSLHENVNWMYSIAFLILLNGILMSSRLIMKAHTIKELVIGFGLGVIPQLVLLRFWL